MSTFPRRALGAGPTAPIRAAEADLEPLPGVGFPDLAALRARGVLGPQPAAAPSPSRRTLGTR
ncbi:hypothetical protein [Streptomyces filamentosus]|uniref:hypothetical protein n=1 Tax=Streptomyces filamentosus TaxID=67294 RepID=UPI0033179E86